VWGDRPREKNFGAEGEVLKGFRGKGCLKIRGVGELYWGVLFEK